MWVWPTTNEDPGATLTLDQLEVGDCLDVWMSHGDKVHTVAPVFESIAHTSSTPFAAFAHKTKPLYGVQFHPEAILTEHGHQLLANFFALAA